MATAVDMLWTVLEQQPFQHSANADIIAGLFPPESCHQMHSQQKERCDCLLAWGKNISP